MGSSKNAKRHRPTEVKIDLDVYFLPERLPKALRFPLEAAGGPDALIRLDHANGYLSPTTEGDKGWQVTLTICPPGEGHFMGIDLSIPQAKRLIKELEYLIKWQKSLKDLAGAAPEAGKKSKGKDKGKDEKEKTKKPKATTKETAKTKAKKK